MRDRTVTRVESWDARPFSGGFATLRDLADGNFSGVVVNGDAWLFMLNGRVVGIVDGDIDDFEDASGTMYEAPDPSLPLLFSMQERGGTTQAKYYTNDTPLKEADSTLSDANFTGYVELSENVLSGDYYLVYYGGRALPVAFVGTTDDLKTGDDAYELAADEVGVYEVIKAPVNVTQLPEPSSDDSTDAVAAGTGAAAANGTGAQQTEPQEPTQTHSDENGDAVTSVASDTEPVVESAESTDESVVQSTDDGPDETTDDTPTGTRVETPAAESSTADPADATSEPQIGATESQPDASAESYADRTTDTHAEPASDGTDELPSEPEPRGADGAAGGATDDAVSSGGTPSDSPASDEGSVSTSTNGRSSETTTTDQAADGAEQDEGRTVFNEEEQWRKTKSIPSLSPSEREKRRHEDDTARGTGEERRANRTDANPDDDPGYQQPTTGSYLSESTSSPSTGTNRADAGDEDTPEASGTRKSVSSTESASEDASTSSEESTTRQSEPDSRDATDGQGPAEGPPVGSESTAAIKERVGTLEARIETLGEEREALSGELDSVRSERDELQHRVRQLEQELEESGGEPTPGPSLTPDEALAGTNLFVRYGSKGQPTLDDLMSKNPDPDAINKNLRIDNHTQFESDDASIGGVPFDQFLDSSSVYRFVSWLVRELPYEIVDAGHRSGLENLYSIVPDIDRAEIQGVVDVETDEDGVEHREFDVVLRDRMGNPLVVADLNDERDPVTGDEMSSLVESARVVGDGVDTLGAAFYVTASFFAPDALENAGEATANGGFLSRSDRLSYVKLGRKQGFHLCLAEDRNESFHLTVPEL